VGADRRALSPERRARGGLACVDGLPGAADEAGDHDGLVEIAELARYAETAVLERSAGRQRPTMPTVKGGENFALARRAAR
jgi:hypothetical protein